MSKFKESPNTAVFTTIYVINNNSPITNVFHYSNGSWQFNGKEINLKDSDYKVVSLEEIIKFDNTIEELSTMPVQFYATRINKNDKWVLFTLID